MPTLKKLGSGYICETDYCGLECFIHVVASLFLEKQCRHDPNTVRVDFIEVPCMRQ